MPATSPCCRAVVVDDHASVRASVARLLTRAGFSVVGTACDGHEAIALTEQLMPDVVVMDLAMPGLDGVEATRSLRARGIAAAIVALTASTPLAARALEAGVHACVFKDAPPSELIAAVHAATAA